MIFIEKVATNREAFAQKVSSIAKALNIPSGWLMAMMYLESGLNPQAVNKQSSNVAGYDEDGNLVKKKGTADNPMALHRAKYRATGLIQFMPRTAKGLGTTNQKLYQMTNIQQLDYVYKYYQSYAGKIKSFEDLYTINFFPIALGKPLTWVLKTSNMSAESIAQQNPGFDLNKDKQITYAEFLQAIRKILKTKLGEGLYTEVIEKKKSENQ